ncbi:MAG: 30S ribosomal protein S16 [Bacteroidia bacterium]
MPVKIRLQRHGRKKLPYYYIVVADSRAPRDGKFIERLGAYNPTTDPATINIDQEKALDWLRKGAVPTDTARAILSYKGIMYKKHLQRGVDKGALTQEDADQKWNSWMDEKKTQVESKVERLATETEKEAIERLDREAKVSEKRAEALKARRMAEIESQAPAEEETPEEEAPKEEAPKEEATASSEGADEVAENKEKE